MFRTHINSFAANTPYDAYVCFWVVTKMVTKQKN